MPGPPSYPPPLPPHHLTCSIEERLRRNSPLHYQPPQPRPARLKRSRPIHRDRPQSLSHLTATMTSNAYRHRRPATRFSGALTSLDPRLLRRPSPTKTDCDCPPNKQLSLFRLTLMMKSRGEHITRLARFFKRNIADLPSSDATSGPGSVLKPEGNSAMNALQTHLERHFTD